MAPVLPLPYSLISTPFIEELSRVATCFVSIYPNAGLPNEMGEYEQTAETIDKELSKLVENAYARAKEILITNKDKLEILARKQKGMTPQVIRSSHHIRMRFRFN